MPLTKEQILTNLSLIDLGRLEKLYTYSQTLLIPEEDLLVNATMSSMLDKAFALADTYFPQWTDRGMSDFGRFIIELACLFSEKDFWYINAFGNEAIFSKMSVYSDAFVQAIVLGYDPRFCKSAQATFNLIFKAGDAYSFPKGSLVINLPGTNLSFTNNEAVNVNASANLITMPVVLYEGQTQKENVVYNGHNILLDKPMIDVESIDVIINNLQWARVRTFGRSSANSPHYIVIPEDNGAASIFFGEDGYGLTPDLGTPITVVYRVTKGDAGNITQVFNAQVSSKNDFRQVLNAAMITAATDGSLPESLSSIKANVPLYFSSKKAAINVDIVQAILNTYPEVKKSKATVVGNTVYVRIIPSDGSVASGPLLLNIAARINPNLMLGYQVLGQQTSYVDVSGTDITIYALKGYNFADVETNVRQFIQDFTDPMVLADYGVDFDLSEISVLLKSRVPGVQQVVFNTVAGAPPQSIVVDATKILSRIPDNGLIIHVNAV